jgi:hypothetical protein
MVRKHRTLCSLSVLLVLGALPTPARASGHREAPAIADDPAADNTDLHAWVDTVSHEKLEVVSTSSRSRKPPADRTFTSSRTMCCTRCAVTCGSVAPARNAEPSARAVPGGIDSGDGSVRRFSLVGESTRRADKEMTL